MGITLDQFIIWQNTFLFLLDLCLVGLFANYLFHKVRRDQWQSASRSAGTALMVYFLGAALARGSGTHVIALVIGTLVMVFGATCILRLFAEYAWHVTWLWVAMVVVSSIGAVVAAMH